MKTIKKYSLFLFIITNCIYSQSPDIIWKKSYGLNTADDFGRSVIETSDGGIAVAGYTGSFGAGGFDVWLIKTDSNGDTLWTKTYGGVSSDFGYSLKQADDGGYIIGGAAPSLITGGLDLLLIRTDSLGELLWLKTYDELNTDYGWSINITKDGGIIICGEQNAFPQTPDGMVIKTDSMGEVEWQKTFGTTNVDHFYGVQQTTDSGYIICGAVGVGIFKGWLLKLDTNGDTLWTRIYGGELSGWFQSILETEDGGFILTGLLSTADPENPDLWLLKTDSAGNVEWSKTYDYNNEYDIGYSVQQTIDGGYIVCGSGGWDVDYGWIIRTDELGDTLWTKSIESYSSDNVLSSLDTDFYSIIQLSNGDYIATGNQPYLPVSDHAQQLLLMRISSDIVPVELTSFTATAQQNAVPLNWQTATETNNSGFEIERSLSPTPSQKEGAFETIAFVPGFGTTTEPKSYSFTDENLSSGKYQYRLKQIDFDGTFEYSNTVEVEINSPTEFSLEQNFPNPFNPTTKIKYTIPSVTLRQAQGDILVSLKVFDVLGNEVATLVNEQQQPGTYEVEFNVGQAISLSSGVYYYQLRSGSFVETKKMLILK
ncbi:MAG: T9SS type A sorting domain-containing protein [Ignavibacteriales bacterium]|nr:T9SS type A sorting domain-containing protein [Ignavibacteriales bacterium]